MLSLCCRGCIELDTQYDKNISGVPVCRAGGCGEPSRAEKFVYDLPENVVEVHELYLEDADWRPKELKRAARLKLNEREYAALRSLLMNQNVDWDTLFSFFGRRNSL